MDGDFKEMYVGDGDGKIDINGNTYTKGIVAHAPSLIKFSLGSKYDRFSVCFLFYFVFLRSTNTRNLRLEHSWGKKDVYGRSKS